MVVLTSATKPSAVHSSGMVNSVVSITGSGDHDRPDWLIRITGDRTGQSNRRAVGRGLG